MRGLEKFLEHKFVNLKMPGNRIISEIIIRAFNVESTIAFLL